MRPRRWILGVLVLLAGGMRSPSRAADATPPPVRSDVGRGAAGTWDARQNFLACVNGEAGRCDAARLTPAERTLVENAASQRNYVACANGWASGCDPLRLTPEQKRIVDAAVAQQAAAPCGSKWALGCGSTSASPTGEASERRTSVETGAPRSSLGTQRSYAEGYPAYAWDERRYAWSAASWLVPTAIVAAATWPLWTQSYHYDWPSSWYYYPAWWGGYGYGGWNHHGHHGGFEDHHWDDGDSGHHHGDHPGYRPPPATKHPPKAPPSRAQPIKRDWR